MLGDREVDKRAQILKAAIDAVIEDAVSQTKVPFLLHTPGVRFVVEKVLQFCTGYTATLTPDVRLVGPNEIIRTGALAVHSTPAQFITGNAIWYMAGGLLRTKAAATGLTFSQAFTVAQNKFGISLIVIDSTGTITTVEPSAAQSYNSLAEAVAALPATPAGKCALGYVTIAPTAGVFTANTTALTTIGVFTNATEARSCLTPAAFAVGTVLPTMSTTLANIRGSETDSIVGIYTSDGTGAVVGPLVRVSFRLKW